MSFGSSLGDHSSYDDFWQREYFATLKDIKPAVMTVGGFLMRRIYTDL
jgi:hypothetical protein